MSGKMLNNEQNYNETENVQQTAGQTGQVNNQAQTENTNLGEAVNKSTAEVQVQKIPNSLEQGLTEKVSELEAQRRVRETLLVDITLEVIADGVVSKEQDIIQLMSGKQWQAALREIVIREVKRAAPDFGNWQLKSFILIIAY